MPYTETNLVSKRDSSIILAILQAAIETSYLSIQQICIEFLLYAVHY